MELYPSCTWTICNKYDNTDRLSNNVSHYIIDAQRTKRDPMQLADNAGPDQPADPDQPAHNQGLRCPLTESIVAAVDEQRMPRSDCSGAHAELGPRCSHMT